MPNMVTGSSATTTFDPSAPASSSWRRLDDIASAWKSWKQANNVRIEPVFENLSPEPTNLNKPTNPTRSVPVSKTRAANLSREASNSTKSLPPQSPQEDVPKKEKKSGSPLPWQSPRAKALKKEAAPQPKASSSSKSSGFLNRQRSISDQQSKLSPKPSLSRRQLASDQQSNLSPKPSLSRRQPATPPEPKPSSSTNPAKRMASFLQRNNTISSSRQKPGSSPLRSRPSVSPPRPNSSTSPPRPRTGMLPPRPKATSSPPRPKTTSSPPRPKTTSSPPRPKANSLPKSSIKSREHPTPAHRPSSTSYSKPSLSSNTALLTQCIEVALLNRPAPSGDKDPSQLLVPPPLKISKSPLPRRQHLTKSKSSLAMRASSILPPIVEQTLAEEEEEKEEEEDEDEGQDGHNGFARTSKLIAPQSTKSSQRLSSPIASTSASRQRKSSEITITGSSNYRRVRKRSNPLRVAITPSISGSPAKSDAKITERVRTTSNPRVKALPDKAISESEKAVQETTRALVTPATVEKAHKTAEETPASNSKAPSTLPFVPIKNTVSTKGEKQDVPALKFSKIAVKVADPVEESPVLSASFSTPAQRSLLSELLTQPSISSTTSRDTKFTVKSKLELSAQRRRMLKQDSALRKRHHSFNCATDLGLEAVIDSMDFLDGKAHSHPVVGLFGADFTAEGRTASGLTVSTFAGTSLKPGAPRRHTMPEALLEAAADILQEALEMESTVW